MDDKGKYFPIILILLFLCSKSYAGAWLPNKNENQIIISAIQNNDNNQNVEIYFEHGINQKIAVIYEQGFAIENGTNEIGEALLATRYRVIKKDNWIASTQFGLVANDFSNFKNTKFSYELRALLGYGYSNGWANVELATRECSGSSSLRWETTFGLNAFKRDKFILKAFGENDGCAKDISRAQISYVKAINEKMGIEFGYRQGIGNDKLYSPASFLIGIWGKF